VCAQISLAIANWRFLGMAVSRLAGSFRTHPTMRRDDHLSFSQVRERGQMSD
jgi:hypothetical protein